MKKTLLEKRSNKSIDIIDTTNEPNILQKMDGRGGTRKGSGAKPKYNEGTKTIAFRCPLSKVDELKLVVKSKLSEWSVK
jgi:hypothetical protein